VTNKDEPDKKISLLLSKRSQNVY